MENTERIIEDTSNLSGSEKAATLLLSLPPDYAKKIFEKLDNNEIQEVSQAMSNLGRVKAEAVENIFHEFSDNLSSTGNLRGTYDSTERLLSKILDGSRVKSIMEEIRGPMGRTVWDKLSNISEDVLANFLKHEHPQTVAVIMSKLRSSHASGILTLFSEDFSHQVIERMLRMDVVKKEVLDNIENTLRAEFMNTLSKTSQRDTHEIMAEIFNSFDRATESKFIEYLENKAPESAERIKALMFTFEDLTRIDSKGIQQLIQKVDKAKLALALKGTSAAVKDLIFTNMSERAAKLMKEDIEAMGMVRLKDVEEAQLEIVTVAKTMADEGTIILKSAEEEEAMIS